MGATNQDLRRMDDERFDRLEKKVDDILERVLQLPCKEGSARYTSLEKEIGWIQKILYGLIPVVLGTAVAWGVLSNTVETNSGKWAKLEPEHMTLVKDVEVLKEKSYGFRAVPVMVDNGKTMS